jgi:hypothetical protein
VHARSPGRLQRAAAKGRRHAMHTCGQGTAEFSVWCNIPSAIVPAPEGAAETSTKGTFVPCNQAAQAAFVRFLAARLKAPDAKLPDFCTKR